MQQITDLTLQQLQVVEAQLSTFMAQEAYQLLLDSLEGETVTLEKVALNFPLDTINALYEREKAIGAAVQSSRYEEIFPQLVDEIAAALVEKKNKQQY